MATSSRDLFDDSTMTFGEHLEVLRVHLWKAILGIAICVCGALIKGDALIAVIREPIDNALAAYGTRIKVDEQGLDQTGSRWEQLKNWWNEQWGIDSPEVIAAREAEAAQAAAAKAAGDDVSDTLVVSLSAYELGSQLHQADPQAYPEPAEGLKEKPLSLTLTSPAFADWNFTRSQLNRPVTLNVQEAFMTYVKVSMIGGLVISSPWVFYQVWMFVAAGLYRHERKFVYLYGLMSLALFLVGVVFCFKLVFPTMLDWLLKFNMWLEIQPQIRLSEWISFAVILPLMFGISFQLPLVMRFLQAISLFSVDVYREKRRMAILVIAILSVVLTPADPMSMILMMVPLVFLYEVGIVLCRFSPAQNPFEPGPV